MTVATFSSSARSLAPLRPAGSSRDRTGGSQVIRLVDLIDAETDPARSRPGGRSLGTRRRLPGPRGRTRRSDHRDRHHARRPPRPRRGHHPVGQDGVPQVADHVARRFLTTPDDLSIVIVDFKGGVDHELSALLPHVIDLSTNHNVDSFVRTVQLIEAELERRQREFKGVGAPNFDAYRVARRASPSLLPIPRLMVIIDEFSELLSSETGKANLSSLESVTRVGGGLGVHLLLVTQNFENQLPSQIAANAGLRICFRVQEPSHSKPCSNSPEAASLPKERIGRRPALARRAGHRVPGGAGGRPRVPARRSSPPRCRPGSCRSHGGGLASGAADSHVPAADTDMYSVVEVINGAATPQRVDGAGRALAQGSASGSQHRRLPECQNGLAGRHASTSPKGRHSRRRLEAYGPHTLSSAAPQHE